MDVDLDPIYNIKDSRLIERRGVGLSDLDNLEVRRRQTAKYCKVMRLSCTDAADSMHDSIGSLVLEEE